MIDPVLAAVGWNTKNFSEVDREYKVYDGTFLDYALRIDGHPKLFIEAKAVGKNLADKQFITQFSQLCEQRRRDLVRPDQWAHLPGVQSRTSQSPWTRNSCLRSTSPKP